MCSLRLVKTLALALLVLGLPASTSAAPPNRPALWDLSFSRDSRHLLTCGDQLRVFDLREPAPRTPLKQPWKAFGWSRRAAFSPGDATLLAVARDTGHVTLLRLGQAEPVLEIPVEEAVRGSACHDVVFSPDGRLLAVAFSKLAEGSFVDGQLRIHDVETGKLVHSVTREENKISGVAFSRDGGRLAFCCGPDLEVFDRSPWEGVGTVKLPTGGFHEDDGAFALSATFLQDENHLVVGGGICAGLRNKMGCNTTGLLWLIDFEGQARLDEEPRPNYIRSVDASPDGQQFVTAYYDQQGTHVTLSEANGTVRWSTAKARELFGGDPYGLQISPDGKRVGWCDDDGIHLLDAATGEGRETIEVNPPLK